jgi:Family of unknown function (DUF5946)
MYSDDGAYWELSAYTLSHGDAAFIHQHVVDAYAVQSAAPSDKPIRVAQGLVGLYLHVERGFDGRQVQRVHQIVANRRPEWPTFALPPDRGPMSVRDVLAFAPGPGRDHAIETWVESTWIACRDLRDSVAVFLSAHGIDLPDHRESSP